MYTVSECCAPDFAMDGSVKDFPASPDRVRIKGRGGSGLELAIVRSSSPVPATCESPRETNHHWWDVLKGLGRRRRKSTTNAYAADFFDVTWQLNQVERLSEDKTNEEYVTSLAYDETGEILAAGCKDGRVFVYQRQNQQKLDHRSDHSTNGRPFQLYSCFQSHEKEFDHLKSVETDEKICRLHFLKRPNRHHFLLSANDRNVKLWKLSEKLVEFDDDSILTSEATTKFNRTNNYSLRIPRYRPTDPTVCAFPKRVYFASHNLRLNALSASCDLETFLTADDLTINLWHVEVPDLSFNIVDAKPDNIEDLSEVITAAEFHPSSCSQFAYASSKGSIRLCDMRSNSLCDHHSKLFHDNKDEQPKSFFSDIICCICDAKFSYDGQYLLTRDYLNLKVWDLRIESRPVETYSVCEPLRGKLSRLYESDQIFDKFECSWGYNDRFISTGTYGNYFKVVDRISGHAVTLKTTDSSSKGRQQRRRKNSVGSRSVRAADEPNVERLDFRTKCAHTLWNPVDHILTNATANGLNFFHVRQNGGEQHGQAN